MAAMMDMITAMRPGTTMFRLARVSLYQIRVSAEATWGRRPTLQKGVDGVAGDDGIGVVHGDGRGIRIAPVQEELNRRPSSRRPRSRSNPGGITRAALTFPASTASAASR